MCTMGIVQMTPRFLPDLMDSYPSMYILVSDQTQGYTMQIYEALSLYMFSFGVNLLTNSNFLILPQLQSVS